MPPAIKPGKSNGNGGGCGVGNPINPSIGNKYQIETDYQNISPLPIKSTRTYNSYFVGRGIDYKWMNDFSQAIAFSSVATDAYLVRPDGRQYKFSQSGNIWRSDADLTDKLTDLKDTSGNRTGWTYTIDATGEVESYDAVGKLLTITDRAGNTQSLTYSNINTSSSVAPVAGLLIKVTNRLGHSLNFTYDSASRINTMIDPSGGVYTYAYSTDVNNNLISVTYPDGKVKTYLYGEAAYVSPTPNNGVSYANALTGIIDENGKRFATYKYDSAGRAYSTEHAVGIEKNTLAYNLDSNGNPASTVVTEPNGTARTYNFTTVLGVVKSTGQNQPAGSGCSASASNLTYDSNGNIATRTDLVVIPPDTQPTISLVTLS